MKQPPDYQFVPEFSKEAFEWRKERMEQCAQYEVRLAYREKTIRVIVNGQPMTWGEFIDVFVDWCTRRGEEPF